MSIKSFIQNRMSFQSYAGAWLNQAPLKLDPIQRYWLARPGALTAGLRQLGQLHIEVLNESYASLDRDEAIALQLPIRHPLWLREIIMSIDGTPCVLARSITPISAARGVWKSIRALNTRPLADILYNDPRIIRSRFECAPVQAGRQIFLTQERYFPKYSARPDYARRSIFYKESHPLMVTESFLETFWLLLDQFDGNKMP